VALSGTLAGDARTGPPQNAEPLTVAVLRRKLDAAIVAEAWDAVKAIQQRIVVLEREAAGNVVALDAARGKRGAP